MATTDSIESSSSELSKKSNQRSWQEFAIRGFAAIVARKHNIVVPLDDINSISDEELASRLRLVSEYAHLPPA